CAPAPSIARSPTAFAANGAPPSTPISDPSSKPHGEDQSEPSTPSASPSKAAPSLAQLENANGDLSNYKTIISIAGGLDVGQFSSGRAAFTLLTRLGFTVEPLRLPTENETIA